MSAAHNPNTLGEPRQIGAYANAVAYHPNGGIASFNYGSTTTGIKHGTTQNERGLPVQSTDSGGVRADQYGYDASANVASIADLLPSNVSSRSMTYDGLDRLKTRAAPNMWGTATYGYDALDNLTSTTITSGISARNTLHSINATTNRLDSITNGPAGFNVSYGYDASANVASIADLLPSNVSSRSMTYDGLDRLKTTAAPNMWGTATYGYDALDNLTSTTITGGISARNMLHNINATTNRLDSITNGPAGFNVSYGYDVRGNVTQRNSQVFEYDLGDRMKRAVGRATYTYDGFKRRVSVVGTEGVTRVQVYAQDGKLLYIAPSGGTPTKYVYLRNHVLAEVSGSSVTYSHTDALGSPVAQTNAAGAVLIRTRYEPYGYIVAGTPRTIGFTGHVNDNDTGLVYMQQRYYDAVAGRFLGVDPVVTDANTGGSFNRYAYANNSPYKYVDPDGREAACITVGTKCGLGSVSPEELTARVSTIADFVPVVGDIKSFIEAMRNPSVANIAAVGLGIIPVVGDGAAKVIKAAEKAETAAVRTTQAGEKAVRITRADGSVKDISPARVKEYVPNTHPKAPPGTLDRVKFENPLPGSKGFKREPTTEELNFLKEAE